MYTQCPQCLTYFQVTPEHLRIAQGNVRCGQCRNVFSALGNLTEEPPQAPFDSNNEEIEEEIFIDEAELENYSEEYAEEYPEEFYIVEEELEEEIDHELADDDEVYREDQLVADVDEEPPEKSRSTAAAAAPINLEKTNIMPARPPQPEPPPNRTLPNSQKLSEAIATIEKLKQNYSNLSIRQLDKRGPLPTVKSTSDPQTTVPETIPSAVTPPQAESPPPAASPAPAASQPAYMEPSPPPSAPAAEAAPKPPADIAFDHYPDEDGVDYEEALNALNELKIADEEIEADTPLSKPKGQTQAKAEKTAKKTEKTPPKPDEILDDFSSDLSIDEADITGDDQALFVDETLRQELLAEDEDEQEIDSVKVKSLDRRGEESSAPSKPAQPAEKQKSAKRDKGKAPAEPAEEMESSAVESEEPPKYLPAIPKQLLEDFHPGHGQDAHHHPLSLTLWSAGSIVLMVIFLLQTVYFKHNDLARAPSLRPWIETFCGYMSCDFNLPTDVRQLELVSHDIRSHPKVKSALLVTTTIINNAGFTQPYPGLQITFSDLNGQRVAMRRFAPREYLAPGIKQDAGMPPNTPVQVELEMMDPGSNAVNFEFDFIPLS